MVMMMMALLVVFTIQQFASSSTSTGYNDQSQRGLKPLPLSQFPTLNNALESAEMVGLYFAASWCPMSTGPTEKLGEIFGGSDALTALGPSGKPRFSIVYVSSDKTKESMDSYMKPDWIGIPYDSAERTALKKHFSTCAQREVPELGIERKHEIPSLFIFDGESHGLITTNGVPDLKEHSNQPVLEHWRGLQHIVRALSEKYID